MSESLNLGVEVPTNPKRRPLTNQESHILDRMGSVSSIIDHRNVNHIAKVSKTVNDNLLSRRDDSPPQKYHF